MQNQNVLVVDDDELFGRVLADMLRFLDYKPTVCTTASQGLGVAKSCTPDLIFADVRMPEIDGLDFYKFLATLDRQLARRVIFVTGDLSNPHTRELIEKTGAVALEKPVAFEALEKAIATTNERLRTGSPPPEKPADNVRAPEPAAADAPQTALDPVSQILELERKWNQALLNADLPTLERLLADDFSSIHYSGTAWTRSVYLSLLDSSARVVDSIAVTESAVRLYGNAAVVTGQMSVKESFKGSQRNGEYRFTNTWVQRGDSWQCVAGHATLIRHFAT